VTSSSPESAVSGGNSSSSPETKPIRKLSGLEAPDAPLPKRRNYASLEANSASGSDESVDDDEDFDSSSDESSDHEEDAQSEEDEGVDTDGHTNHIQIDDKAEDAEGDPEETSDRYSISSENPVDAIRIRVSHTRSITQLPDDTIIIEEIDSESIEFDGLPILYPFSFSDADSCAASQNDQDEDIDSSDDDSSSSDSSEDDTMSPNDRDLARAQKEFDRLQIHRRHVRKRRRKIGGDHKRKHDQAIGSDLDIEDVCPLLEDDCFPHPQLPILLPTKSSRHRSKVSDQRRMSNASIAATRRIRRRTDEGPGERERPRTSVLWNDIPPEIAEIHYEEQEVVIDDGDAENEEVIFPPWFHGPSTMDLDDEDDDDEEDEEDEEL
jgi:hypothetical protein